MKKISRTNAQRDGAIYTTKVLQYLQKTAPQMNKYNPLILGDSYSAHETIELVMGTPFSLATGKCGKNEPWKKLKGRI